jgi:hypothetical protein
LQGEPGQPENLKFSRGSTEMTFRQLKNLKFFREPTEMTLVLTEKPEIFSWANWNDHRVNWKIGKNFSLQLKQKTKNDLKFFSGPTEITVPPIWPTDAYHKQCIINQIGVLI